MSFLDFQRSTRTSTVTLQKRNLPKKRIPINERNPCFRYSKALRDLLISKIEVKRLCLSHFRASGKVPLLLQLVLIQVRSRWELFEYWAWSETKSLDDVQIAECEL